MTADTATPSSMSSNNGQLSPTNGLPTQPIQIQTASGGASATPALGMSAANGGRKRPLLAGGPRASMTPTKRTVMSLLARARAAQAKQLPATFQRGAPECCIVDALPLQWNYFEKASSPPKIICRAGGTSILERFEYLS
nr:uncharacterized protein LOC111423672 isoform X1 [Onthophagus taurus]